MSRLAAVPERRATFQEDKTIAALATPVHANGRLAFRRPGYLEKITYPPAAETIIVDGPRLAITLGDEPPRSVDLDAHPEVGALVEAIRGTLAGDLPALRRSYAVSMDGSAAGAWRLTLRPADLRVAQLVRQVEIDGRGADLGRVDIQQANGDRSVMTITDLP